MDARSSNMELLSRSPFFAAAGPAAMEEFVRSSFTQLVPRGTVLFEQGNIPNFAHFVLSGRVGLQARAESRNRTIVEIFGPGEVCLIPAVLLQLPYLASGLALTEVRVLMVPAEDFRAGVARNIALTTATMELLARHWRLMVDQVIDLKLRDAGQRVLRFVERRLEEENSEGVAELPEPRMAIAARLGMTPATLSRILTTLEEQGRIRRDPAADQG